MVCACQDVGEEGSWRHVPVMVDEVLRWLEPRPGGDYIDGTVGLGGHTAAILEASAPDGRVLAIDTDPQALELAHRNLAGQGQRVAFAQGRHSDLQRIAADHGFTGCAGVLLDLGVSSLQLDDARRGFSFREAGPLDMRMGPEAPYSADEIVNGWDEHDLAQIIYEYGEERFGRRVARAIVGARPIRDTEQLAQVVARAVGGSGRIHPATRTFQAIRIAANDELGSLRRVLPQALEVLAPGGVLVVISFHSLEDRIVKQYMVRESQGCLCPPRLPVCECGHARQIERLTRRPVVADAQEIARNPRSRSARLRAAKKLDAEQARAAESELLARSQRAR